MTGLIEKSVLLGIGILTLTRDKVAQAVNKLVEEGEVKAEEAPNVIERLVARGEEEREALRQMVRDELEKARMNIPVVSRKDIEALSQKIDELAAKVEAIAGES